MKSVESPGHPEAVAATLYVTDSIEKPALKSVWLIENPPPPEKPVTAGELPKARQAKVDPGTSACSKIAVEVLLQSWKDVVIFEITGRGLTTSKTFWETPGAHPLAAGVTLYVTDSTVLPELDIVCTIIFPLLL